MKSFKQFISEDITETSTFKSWFGRSKVVDSSGKPLVVYHGSGVEIQEFDYIYTNQGNDQIGSGFYFTTDITEAEGYRSATIEGRDKLGGSSKPTLHSVYLSISNPLDADKIGRFTPTQVRRIIMASPVLEDALSNWGDVEYEGRRKVIDTAVNAYVVHGTQILMTLNNLANDFFPDRVREFIKAVFDALKYDGVVKHHETGVTHYVAFFPTQIKSAEHNDGFDPTDPNIHH